MSRREDKEKRTLEGMDLVIRREMSINAASKKVGVETEHLHGCLITPHYILDYGEKLEEDGTKIPPAYVMWLCLAFKVEPASMYVSVTDTIEGIGTYEDEDYCIADLDWPAVNDETPEDFMSHIRLLTLNACMDGWTYAVAGQSTFTSVRRVYLLLFNVALLMPYAFACNVAGFSDNAKYHWMKERDNSPTAKVMAAAIEAAEQFGIAYAHQRTLFGKDKNALNPLKLLERRYSQHYSSRTEQVVHQTTQVLPQDMTDTELDALLAGG